MELGSKKERKEHEKGNDEFWQKLLEFIERN